MKLILKQRSVLPGFGLTLGFTVLYLSLIVLDPAVAPLFLKTSTLTWRAVLARRSSSPAALASYRLSFGASLIGGARSTLVFGLLVAWVLVRYRFPGKRLVDALVDLPFALPTAVAGIALTTLYARNGWIGRQLAPLGIKVAFTPLGRRDRADLRRPAVRGAHGAAGARGPRTRSWKRRPPAWARAAGRPSPRDPAGALAGAADRLRAGLRPGDGRIRLGDLHLRQHADADRDHAAADRHQAGAVRLRRRDRDRGGDAGGFVRAAAGHQPAAVVEQQPARAEARQAGGL